jgi:AraC-like DNA-binding protein
MYMILTLTSLVTFLFSNFRIFPIDTQASFSIISACMVLIIFYLSFYGIKQYSIAEYYGRESKDGESKEKYKTSSLTSTEQETIYGKLLTLFETESVYQESRLQLQDVADKLNIPAHSLSQTINTMTGKPFYDFVNGYRVTYLQRHLEDPTQKRFTILALGLESGFNSKASLNRVFKEHTGLSPSAYQRHHLPK